MNKDEISNTDGLEELKQWKQQNEQLSLDNEQLTQEIKTLEMQMNAYESEISKLKTESNDLSEEIQENISKTNEMETLQNNYEKLEQVVQGLHTFCAESQTKMQTDANFIKELERTNNQLTEENTQYELILEKLQREEASLKDKIHKESQQLRDLKDKYAELDIEYHTTKAFAKHTSVVAANLQSEVADLQSQYESTLQTINSDQVHDFAAMQGMSGGHSAQKTLRLADVNSGNGLFTIFDTTTPLITPGTPAGHPQTSSILMGRHSIRGTNRRRISLFDATSLRFVQFEENDEDNFNPYAGLVSDGYGSTRSNDFNNSGMEDIKEYNEDLREKLEIEFEDKFAKEKEALTEKHEMEKVKLNTKVVKYKKEIMVKSKKIDELKKQVKNHLKHERNHRNNGFNQRPNNVQDMSQCKVFGWKAW